MKLVSPLESILGFWCDEVCTQTTATNKQLQLKMKYLLGTWANHYIIPHLSAWVDIYAFVRGGEKLCVDTNNHCITHPGVLPLKPYHQPTNCIILHLLCPHKYNYIYLLVSGGERLCMDSNNRFITHPSVPPLQPYHQPTNCINITSSLST